MMFIQLIQYANIVCATSTSFLFAQNTSRSFLWDFGNVTSKTSSPTSRFQGYRYSACPSGGIMNHDLQTANAEAIGEDPPVLLRQNATNAAINLLPFVETRNE